MRLPLPHRPRPARRRLIAAALTTAAAAALAAGSAPPVVPAAPPAVPPVHDQDPPTDAPSLAADAAFADRIEAIAELSFPPRVPVGRDQLFVFGQQAALMQASATLDPASARYSRKRAEALHAVGDVDGEIDALRRTVAVSHDDELSWIRLVDLETDKLPAAPDQLALLTAIEAKPNGIPADVQAHAAYRMALIYRDQERTSQVQRYLHLALIHNPFSGEALRLAYFLLPPNTSPFDRAQALLDLLRANPLQPAYARELALLLADVGLVQESLPFFQLAVQTSFAQGRPDLEASLDWASELYIGNLQADAAGLVKKLLQYSPDYASAWYLDLILARSGNLPPAQYAKQLQLATNVMSNRVADAANAVRDAAGPGAAGAAPRATTRPIEAEGNLPLPDLKPAMDALARAGATTQPATVAKPLALARARFIGAVSDLARLEIVFARQPDAAAPMLDALRQMLPANDPLLAQLTGWQQLVAGRDADATATFTPLVITDPLAAMGLIQLQGKDPKQADQADAEARKLIQDHPDRLVGAFLVEGLTSQRVRLAPKANAIALQALVNKFPLELAKFAGAPGRLYTIHISPLDTGREFGQPLLVNVVLTNFGPADLTVGDDGFIRLGMLFQVVPQFQLQPGQAPVMYPAFDGWAGRLVVHHQEQIQQVVRVDQAALLAELDRTAGVIFNIDGKLLTNPDTRLGGTVTQFTQPFARTSVNVNEVARCVTLLENGPAGGNGAAGGGVPDGGGGGHLDKITALGELKAYVMLVRAENRVVDPKVARDVMAVVNAVHRARNEPVVAAVSAWAGYAEFSLISEPDRVTLVRYLAADPDWRHRLIALLLAPALNDRAVTRQVVKLLSADPQSCVRAYALADQGLLDLNVPLTPTTMPAAAPRRGVAPAGVPLGPAAGVGAPVEPGRVPAGAQMPVPIQ
jgi:hypothetical protein